MFKMTFNQLKAILFMFSLVFSVRAFANEANGIMMVVKGDIKVTSLKDGKTEAAKVGKKVYSGDSITAGPDSRAKVVMSDKNILNISPDSKVVIEKYTNDPKSDSRSVELKVEYGKVRAQVEQKYDGEKNKFNIKTPTAVAGVRGTDFITGFNRQTRQSSIVTFSGMVAVGTPGPKGEILNAVFVRPGQTTNVGEGKTPEPPKALPKDDLNNMNQESANNAANNPGPQPDSSPNNASNDSKADKKQDNQQTQSSNDKSNNNQNAGPNNGSSSAQNTGAPENRQDKQQDKGSGAKNNRQPASINPDQNSSGAPAPGPALTNLPPPKFDPNVPQAGPIGPKPPMLLPGSAPILPPTNSFVNETIRNGTGKTKTTIIINQQ